MCAHLLLQSYKKSGAQPIVIASFTAQTDSRRAAALVRGRFPYIKGLAYPLYPDQFAESYTHHPLNHLAVVYYSISLEVTRALRYCTYLPQICYILWSTMQPAPSSCNNFNKRNPCKQMIYTYNTFSRHSPITRLPITSLHSLRTTF